MDIEYTCVHYGKNQPSTSSGKRPVQVHNALDCKMHLRLVFMSAHRIDDCFLMVTRFVDAHNHAVSSDLFACYPKQRRLNENQISFVTALLQVDVQPAQVKLLLQSKEEGKCVTSQDLRNVKSNLKSVERRCKCEGDLLVHTVEDLLSNDLESKVKIISDHQNDIQAVCFMSGRMQRLYKEYGQVLFVDATYKLNIEGFPLLVFLVEDGTGVGVPVMFGFVKYETADILQTVLQWFTSSIDTSVTQVIMVDKDIKMLHLLQSSFSTCAVLLCRFHVLRYIRKKIHGLCVASDVKNQLLALVSAMVYASSDADYDVAFETLQQSSCCDFVSYFVANWHNCKDLWCLAFRKGLLTLGNNTNNRIENFNRQLKRTILPNLHLSEALRRLVNGSYSVSSDIGYRHKRELGTRMDARCDMLPGLFCSVLTNAALALVTSQHVKYNELKTEMQFTTVGDDVYEVRCTGKVYAVSLICTRCTCSFYCNYCLPCSHIFMCRKSVSPPLCDSPLLDAVPRRWKKVTLETAVFTPQTDSQCNSQVFVHSKQVVAKVRFEQDRYMTVQKITTSLCNHLTSCGGNDFEQKLHWISLLLSFWQQNKDVLSDQSSLTVNSVQN